MSHHAARGATIPPSPETGALSVTSSPVSDASPKGRHERILTGAVIAGVLRSQRRGTDDAKFVEIGAVSTIDPTSGDGFDIGSVRVTALRSALPPRGPPPASALLPG